MSPERISFNVVESNKEANYESGLGSLSSNLKKTENRIQELETLNSTEGKKHKIRFLALKNLISNVLCAAMLMTGISEATNYATRYRVDKQTQGTEATFEHEDTETTLWINYISGRVSIPPEIRLNLFREQVGKWIKNNNISLPENFFRMDDKQIENYIFNDPQVSQTTFAIGWKNNMTADKKKFIDELIPNKMPRKDSIYKALWDLELVAGNPKIRPDSSGRAHYIERTNTIFIDIGLNQKYMIDDLIAESAHGVQWETSPLISDAKKLRDTVFLSGQAVLQQKNIDKVHDEYEYKTPGTIEYEAHSIIEPQLHKQFDQEVKKYDLATKQNKKQDQQHNQKHGYTKTNQNKHIS